MNRCPKCNAQNFYSKCKYCNYRKPIERTPQDNFVCSSVYCPQCLQVMQENFPNQFCAVCGWRGREYKLTTIPDVHLFTAGMRSGMRKVLKDWQEGGKNETFFEECRDLFFSKKLIIDAKKSSEYNS